MIHCQVSRSNQKMILSFSIAHEHIPNDTALYQQMLIKEQQMTSGFVNCLCNYIYKDTFPKA